MKRLIMALLLVPIISHQSQPPKVRAFIPSKHVTTSSKRILLPFEQPIYNPSQQLFDAIEKHRAEVAKAKADKIALAKKKAQEAIEAARQAQADKLAAEQKQTIPAVQIRPRPTYSGSLATWLASLRDCESSGNYAENTGNGYYGAYQFTVSTWNSLGTGYARADYAPPSVQDAAIIKNTLRTSGLSSQNPGCYASRGLSNYPPS